MARISVKAFLIASIATAFVLSIVYVLMYSISKVTLPKLSVDVTLTDQAMRRISESGRPVEFTVQIFGYANSTFAPWADGMNKIILSKENVVEYYGHGRVYFNGVHYSKCLLNCLNEDGPFIEISGGYYDRVSNKSLYECSDVFIKLSDMKLDRNFTIRCDAATR